MRHALQSEQDHLRHSTPGRFIAVDHYSNGRSKRQTTDKFPVHQKEQFRQRIMCEVDYPLTKNLPVLYVTRREVSPDTWRQQEQIIMDLFRDAKEWKFLITERADDNLDNKQEGSSFWRLLFDSISKTYAAMNRFKVMVQRKDPRVDGISVTYSCPDGNQGRQISLFISHLPSNDLKEILSLLPQTPAEIMRFAEDSKDVDKVRQGKKTTWRLTFKDEEGARSAFMELRHNPEYKNIYAEYFPDPFTHQLVLCFRTREIPRALFENLSLYWEENYGKIVEEFEYGIENMELLDVRSKQIIKQYPGDIYYDISQWHESSQAYARLVTANWWYTTLFFCLMNASLKICDLYSTFIFCTSLWKPVSGHHPQELYDLRLMVTSFCCVLQLFQFYQCYYNAVLEIRRMRNHAGDIVHTRNYLNEFILLCALCFFYFVQIPGMVKDIVVKLHPWTNQQQKAALKVDGARVFVIGYANEHQYRCDNQMGAHQQYPAILLTRFILTYFKAYVAWTIKSPTAFFLSLTGIILWPWQIYKFYHLLKDREVYSDWLVRQCIKQKLQPRNLSANVVDARRPTQKGIVSNWRKHFEEFNDLTKYSRLRDCKSTSFKNTLVILVILCCFFAVWHNFDMSILLVFVQHWFDREAIVDRISTSEERSSHSKGLSIAGLSAADANGDGHVSAWEIQRALAAGSFGDEKSASVWTVQQLACAMRQAEKLDQPMPTSCCQVQPKLSQESPERDSVLFM